MQKLRVLQLTAGLDIGGLSGGAEAFAVRLAQHLDPAQIESVVFALQLHPTSTVEQVTAQLSAQNIAVFGQLQPIQDLNWANLRILYHALRDCLERFQPQIVNSHSDRCDLLNLLAAHNCLPAIHSVQTVHVERQWITKPRFGSLFMHLLAPIGFDAQVVVSDYLRQQLLRRPLNQWRRSRIHLFYNAIDSKWFEKEEITQVNHSLPLGLPTSGRRIIVIGRLEEQKGHTYLLQAMRKILQEQQVSLVIVGTGSLEQALQSQVERLGLQGTVYFLGHRHDVAALLAYADLLVLPSLWEGFPTILLEAMAQGTTVIATAVAGSSELVKNGETGLLVPPRNSDLLAQAILTLLKNPEQAQKLAKNAKDFARQFTIDKTAAQYAALYQEIVRR